MKRDVSCLQNAVEILSYVVVPESQDLVLGVTQIRIPAKIICSSFRMLTAVELDR